MSAQEYHTTATPIGEWQRPDGWPTPAYFEAIATELDERNVPLGDWSIEEDWEVVYLIGDQDASRSWAVSWRCDELDEPLTDGLTGLAWYRTDGNNVWSFGLGHLEDPEVVAEEIAKWWNGR